MTSFETFSDLFGRYLTFVTMNQGRLVMYDNENCEESAEHNEL